MTLKELIEKLQAFNCEALADKEVVHCFNSSNAYSYKEVISDVQYDAEYGRFMVFCDEPQQALWTTKYKIKANDKKE